jgi:hypothetical protein
MFCIDTYEGRPATDRPKLGPTSPSCGRVNPLFFFPLFVNLSTTRTRAQNVALRRRPAAGEHPDLRERQALNIKHDPAWILPMIGH